MVCVHIGVPFYVVWRSLFNGYYVLLYDYGFIFLHLFLCFRIASCLSKIFDLMLFALLWQFLYILITNFINMWLQYLESTCLSLFRLNFSSWKFILPCNVPPYFKKLLLSGYCCLGYYDLLLRSLGFPQCSSWSLVPNMS